MTRRDATRRARLIFDENTSERFIDPCRSIVAGSERIYESPILSLSKRPLMVVAQCHSLFHRVGKWEIPQRTKPDGTPCCARHGPRPRFYLHGTARYSSTAPQLLLPLPAFLSSSIPGYVRTMARLVGMKKQQQTNHKSNKVVCVLLTNGKVS